MNNNEGDGCSSNCKIETGWKCAVKDSVSACSFCTNQTIEFGETCDFTHDGCKEC